jgi:fructose-bisphosphate aldolase class I
MVDLEHAMRPGVLTDAAFDGSRVLGAIVLQQTERDVDGVPTARDLWEQKQVSFLAVGRGLAEERDGVQLMKQLDDLNDDLAMATQHGMLGRPGIHPRAERSRCRCEPVDQRSLYSCSGRPGCP